MMIQFVSGMIITFNNFLFEKMMLESIMNSSCKNYNRSHEESNLFINYHT